MRSPFGRACLAIATAACGCGPAHAPAPAQVEPPPAESAPAEGTVMPPVGLRAGSTGPGSVYRPPGPVARAAASPTPPPPPEPPQDPAPYSGLVGGARPTRVHVPPGYRTSIPAPLVVMLHGYSATGDIEEEYLRLTAASDARGFLYVHPDGTLDAWGLHFWNATDACCNFAGASVDDSGYLSALIDEIETRYDVDAKRVYVVGHSNGGFMAHRVACDHADQIAAVVSFGGAMLDDISKCTPSEPVAVAEIHGTNDEAIPYAGGSNFGHAYPGAITTAADWATLAGCSLTADTSAPPVDVDALIDGPETVIARYTDGCKPGGEAELWTVRGGTHVPLLAPGFADIVSGFLLSHAKP